MSAFHCHGCCSCMATKGEHPDVAAVLEMNRLTCEHEKVEGAVPRAEVEAWRAAGAMTTVTPYRFIWCLRCKVHVPCYPPKEEAAA